MTNFVVILSIRDNIASYSQKEDAAGVEAAGVKAAGIKAAGIKATGVKAAGVKVFPK